MTSRLFGLVACLALLVGCGGGLKGNLAHVEPFHTDITTSTADEGDEVIAEELSARRVEELLAKSGIRGGDAGLEEELKKWEHQVRFDVPVQMNKQVKAYLVYFSTERKEVIRRYLARSTRYLPMIKDIFREHGLPADLAYLAMIESGFNPKAYSHAAACGMWQFIKGTGLRYGLNINQYVDERRDPEKSTRAAASYLLDLYKQFGSWYLAAASYNCGEGRVQRELQKSSHKNFWELSANRCLPNETKNYVPQLIAATIIAKNPEKFGFTNVAYLAPLKRDKVQVTASTSLQAVATAVNVPVEEVQALNPELTQGGTPPGAAKYTLYVPANSKTIFAKNIGQTRTAMPAVAARPVRTVESSVMAPVPAPTQSGSQTAAACQSQPKPKTYAKSSKKQGTAVTHARKGKAAVNTPTHGDSSPHVASLFGSPAAAPQKEMARKKGVAPAKGKETSRAAAGKSKKNSPALLAGKGKTKNPQVQSAGNKGADASNNKKKASKSKSKALLVSQAR